MTSLKILPDIIVLHLHWRKITLAKVMEFKQTPSSHDQCLCTNGCATSLVY